MYLSQYTPEEVFQSMIGNIHEYGNEVRIGNLFQKNENGELVSLTNPIKIKKDTPEFREFSNIEIDKKRCPCEMNK